VLLRFRHGFPEDWKNLVSFWMKIDEEKKRHAENMSFIWNSTVTNNMSLATGKSQKFSLFVDFAVLGIGSGTGSGSTCFWASWIRIH
jgi:hypothetical protein